MKKSRKSESFAAGAAASSFPRAIRNTDRAPAGSVRGGAHGKERGGEVLDKPTFARLFGGFITLVAFHAVLLWLAVRVLGSAGVVAWSLGALDALALSALYLLWRSVSAWLFGGGKK